MSLLCVVFGVPSDVRVTVKMLGDVGCWVGDEVLGRFAAGGILSQFRDHFELSRWFPFSEGARF